MNKREAKLRALKLCVYCLEQDFSLDGVFDMVDEDTTDDEALRIGHEAREFMKSLHKRIKRLETRLTMREPDVATTEAEQEAALDKLIETRFIMP